LIDSLSEVQLYCRAKTPIRILGKQLLLHNKNEMRAVAPSNKEGSFSQFLWAFEEAVANGSVFTYYTNIAQLSELNL